MTKQKLVARLHDIEWKDFEVKTAKPGLPKHVWESVITFSNTSGGWIVLGVKQNGKKFEFKTLTILRNLNKIYSAQSIATNLIHNFFHAPNDSKLTERI